MDDSNSKAEVERIKREVLEYLRHLQHAPGVQMQEVPPDFRVPRWVYTGRGRRTGYAVREAVPQFVGIAGLAAL